MCRPTGSAGCNDRVVDCAIIEVMGGMTHIKPKIQGSTIQGVIEQKGNQISLALKLICFNKE